MTTATPAPAPVPQRAGYAELAAEIRRLGLLRRRPDFYIPMIAVNLCALVAVVTVMALARDSWWLVLVAAAFAVVSAQIAFVGHDSGHRQVARRSGPSRLLGLLHANLLNGMSYGWWVDKHNAHHAHPNDLDEDPDVRAGALVFDRQQTADRRGLKAWLARHQAWLFFPMLLGEAVNLHVASVRALMRPGVRHRGVEAVLLGVHLLGYAALLVTTMTLLQAVAFVAVHQSVLGLYLGCSFAPNHKGMPMLDETQAADPFLRQVLTSRNIRGGRLVDLALGGLNYQIEHHLFPSMPRPNLPKARPVVQQFCERNGVPYIELSPLASYREVLRHLHDVGTPLRQGAKA
ncbi:MAG TPA: acyl-CoA desaturase [Nocardioides sp.]|uniref:fatty acid desaturase family protein n=1 Tax=Nocardioides sp. TaxID=35761 RepID=UPI002D81006E|nr:acyl-CoA desaturase [Nocardioides sp.]HET6653439.1 acyl-CoA desaturase [Nocardioides sp.]